MTKTDFVQTFELKRKINKKGIENGFNGVLCPFDIRIGWKYGSLLYDIIFSTDLIDETTYKRLIYILLKTRSF